MNEQRVRVGENKIKLSASSPHTLRKQDPAIRREESSVHLQKGQSIPVRRTTLALHVNVDDVEKEKGRTTQQKHPTCHSAPSALTTVSVTGFLQPLHLVLYRCVWQFTHHAYPSFSTNGVLGSNGSPHWAQKKCPACHSAPHATITSPSMGVLHDLQRGEKSSWKSRWQ